MSEKDSESPAGRPIGSPRDESEKVVERFITQVDDWKNRDVHYAPVGGGLSNENWRVVVKGIVEEFFVKIPGAGTEAFVDRSAASDAARQAAEIGIAPKYVLFDPGSGIEVIEYLAQYRACTNGDLKRDDIVANILGMYKRLHESGPLGLTKTVFDMVEEHVSQADDLNARLPADFDFMYREYQAAKDAMLASGLDLVPCHNDPMPGNFLISVEQDMKVIDYEYSSNNERSYDVALIATEMFFDEPRTMSLIETVYGSTPTSTVSRVNVCRALADIKWGLWGCIKRELSRGEWDFDYQKYGLWKLSRARAKIADPRWGSWVASM